MKMVPFTLFFQLIKIEFIYNTLKDLNMNNTIFFLEYKNIKGNIECIK